MPAVGMATEPNTLAGQSLFSDVDIVHLAWTTLGLEWIGHPYERMSFEIYSING